MDFDCKFNLFFILQSLETIILQSAVNQTIYYINCSINLVDEIKTSNVSLSLAAATLSRANQKATADSRLSMPISGIFLKLVISLVNTRKNQLKSTL